MTNNEVQVSKGDNELVITLADDCNCPKDRKRGLTGGDFGGPGCHIECPKYGPLPLSANQAPI